MSKALARDADWAFHATDSAVLAALANGAHAENLREIFGAAAYPELAALARAARGRKKITGGPKVLILPGIMGSRLSDSSRGTAGRRALWIDPSRVAGGRLEDLVLPSPKKIRPMGVLLTSYAKLKLRLRVEGFDADFFPYDWRLGIDELGATLAERIAARGKPVSLIAHSMGGLIARVAAKHLKSRYLRKLIMLGTPNRGSFAPVLALRGTYPFVRKLSRLDHRHSPEYLAEHVFSTFPGIYHMLPLQPASEDLDLLDMNGWPADGFKPNAALLSQVAAARAQLAAPDARMSHIVGVNRETVVRVLRAACGFEYGSSLNGDGTVPAAMAVIPGLKTYYVDESHGNLANNSRVIDAVIDLLRRGTTRALTRRFAPHCGELSFTDDARLRGAAAGKIDWQTLNSTQREALLADLDGGPQVL